MPLHERGNVVTQIMEIVAGYTVPRPLISSKINQSNACSDALVRSKEESEGNIDVHDETFNEY